MKVLFVSLFIVIADQLSKIFVKGSSIPFLHIHFDGMLYGVREPLLGSYLNVTFIENSGIAFGFELGNVFKIFLSFFSILASIGIVYYLYKMKNQNLLFKLSLALILGGAVGNLIDRIFYGVFYGYAPLFYGRVVDFLELKFFEFSVWGLTYNHLPIFNLADVSVCCGVIILLFFRKKITFKERETILMTNPSLNAETTDDI